MGDAPPPSVGSSGDQPSKGSASGTYHGHQPTDGSQAHTEGRTVVDGQPEYASDFQQLYGSPPHHVFSSQVDMAQVQGPARVSPYNMTALANALPQSNYRATQDPSVQQQQQQYQQQRFHPAGTAPGMAAAMQLPQYHGQPALGALVNQQYYLAQNPQMAPFYAPQLSSPQHQHSPSPPRPNMGMYANQLLMNHQQPSQSPPYYYPQQNLQQNQVMANRLMLGQYMASGPPPADPRLSQQPASYDQATGAAHVLVQAGTARVDGRSNVVRGPPRKPRQSGHAIWIGNLPPQTELMSLVHHVCKEAPGLESLFLISKSNCAFANYKDEQTCAAAQQKLHDSKFQSVRLVSRLRKSAVESASGISAPTGPAASTPRGPSSDAAQPAPTVADSDKTTQAAPATDGEAQQLHAQKSDRFFVLKSLTVEDLELSVRTGTWATQSHNEDTLNKAFQAVENVYLIFSANKSGEYFGYARMISPVNEDPAAAIEFAPKAQSTSDLDLPKAISTDATEFAPRGRIIDDSARGTIFWEAEEHEDVVPSSSGGGGEASGPDEESAPGTSTGSADDSSSSAQSGGDSNSVAGGESKAWGKPFKLEWLSVTRLPFYRTRGLRNPWNSNREVKIARDGTELEPSVGRKLIGLFNRAQSPAPPAHLAGMMLGGGGQRVHPGGGLGGVPGYPPVMRPQFPR